MNKIAQKDAILAKKVSKQLKLFSVDHTYPSLKTHKLSGSLSNFWGISIDRSIRMIFERDELGAYFVDLGTHDEVYEN